MRHTNKNEKGMVLVTVIIFGAIIIMLATAMLSTGVMEVKSGNYFENDTQAYYVAKAGADIIAKKIIGKDIMIASFPATFTGNIDTDSYSTVVTKEGNVIQVTSIGESKGVKDEVTVKILVKENATSTFNFDMALFATHTINLTGGALVTGNIGTNSISKNAVILDGGANVNGTIFIGPGGNIDQVINVPSWMTKPTSNVLSQTRVYPNPVMPTAPTGLATPANDIRNYGKKDDFVSGIKDGIMQVSGSISYTFNMNADAYLSRINLLANNTITINVGNEDRVIVVDTLNASNGDIFITGSGNLTMYVRNTFDFDSSYINWDGTNIQPQKLKLYYYGSDAVSFVSDSRFCGIFQSNLAPLTLSGGGNFYGNIFSSTTGNINISGGHQAYTNVLYAPNAIINILGGGNFKGSLIGKDINASGGGVITFNPAGNIAIPVTGGGVSSVTYEKSHYE